MGFSRRVEPDAGTEGSNEAKRLEKKVQPQCKHIVSKYFLASLYSVGCGEDLPQFAIIIIYLLGNGMKGSTLYHSQYVNHDEGRAITSPAIGYRLGWVIHSQQ